MVSESVQRLMDEVDLNRARAATAGTVARTPILASEELRELTGGKVALKCECLQRTGSFKLRGALTKIAALGQDAGAGLVTASAGNHGRAVARAARIRGSQ
jgi:threonine dehydratase